MIENSFDMVFADWRRRAELLDERLHPLVHAEVDIMQPDLASAPHPADTSGLRSEIESLFNEIVDRFETLDAEQRQMVIDLMDENDSLMYSAVIDAGYDTPEEFRRNMILVVIEDQGKDTRDAILALGRYREMGEKRGFDVDAIFREMAKLASTHDKYGWGTTRELFLKY